MSEEAKLETVVELNAIHAASFVPPPNIITVAMNELTPEQFDRFCEVISPLIGAAYVQFIEGERNVARV